MYKTIIFNGFETGYIISENGEVVNTATGQKLKHYPINKYHRYVRIGLLIDGKLRQKGLHRVLMETFCPVENSDSLQVNHIDGNRNNNSLYNLEWVTPSQNVKHAFDHGLMKPMRGEDNPRNVLKEQQVVEICELLSNGITEHEIANKFNVSPTLIHNIRNHIAWVDISSQYTFPDKKGNTRLSEEDVVKICDMVKNGESYKTIAALFGLKPSYIKSFKSKRTWKNITENYDF